jgi:hypothetical protein
MAGLTAFFAFNTRETPGRFFGAVFFFLADLAGATFFATLAALLTFFLGLGETLFVFFFLVAMLKV